jgi:hypothetical protein
MHVPPALFVSLALLVAAAKKCGASSRQITNLNQSIFSFNVYEHNTLSLKSRSIEYHNVECFYAEFHYSSRCYAEFYNAEGRGTI